MEPDACEAKLLAIVQLVREMGLKLVWVRTTPVDDVVHNTRPGMVFHGG